MIAGAVVGFSAALAGCGFAGPIAQGVTAAGTVAIAYHTMKKDDVTVYTKECTFARKMKPSALSRWGVLVNEEVVASADDKGVAEQKAEALAAQGVEYRIINLGDFSKRWRSDEKRQVAIANDLVACHCLGEEKACAAATEGDR